MGWIGDLLYMGKIFDEAMAKYGYMNTAIRNKKIFVELTFFYFALPLCFANGFLLACWVNNNHYFLT